MLVSKAVPRVGDLLPGHICHRRSKILNIGPQLIDLVADFGPGRLIAMTRRCVAGKHDLPHIVWFVGQPPSRYSRSGNDSHSMNGIVQ
jgi:hypothetical protein